MTREQLLEMALSVAVSTIDRSAKKHGAFPPVLTSLQSIANKMQSEQDIAVIKYCFEHPDS